MDERNELDDYTPEEVLGGPGDALLRVPVTVEDTVRVQQLPRRLGGVYSIALSAADPVRILNEDPMRAKVTMWLHTDTGGAAHLSTTQAGASLRAARMHGGMPPLVIESGSEVWARCDAEPTVLAVVIEQWTG